MHPRGQQAPSVKDEVGSSDFGLVELCGLFLELILHERFFVIYQKGEIRSRFTK